MVHGVTSAAAALFRKHEARNLCLWLEMHDVHDADDLFEAFQEAAYRKLGESDWTPLYSAADGRPREKEIERIANSSSKPLMLFIDARETPGGNRERKPEPGHQSLDNGWLDEDKRGQAFVDLAMQLMAKRKNDESIRDGITVVVLCRTKDSPIVKKLKWQCAGHGPVDLDNGIEWPEPELVHGTIEWAESKERCAFLQMLLSLQRTRHLAVAWDQCANFKGASYDEDQDGEKNLWLEKLEDLKLLKRKDGGFIWLNSGLRQKLRKCLRLGIEDITEANIAKVLELGSRRPSETFMKNLRAWVNTRLSNIGQSQKDVHLRVAVWYLKVFDSTGTSRAVIESIDHRMFAVDSLIRTVNASTPADECKAALEEACGILDSARHLLREHLFKIQTEGNPQASRRRLDYIRDYAVESYEYDSSLALYIDQVRDRRANRSKKESDAWGSLEKAIAKLQCAAVEVVRAICREIGEDKQAYERHREVGVRTICDKPLGSKIVEEKPKVREGIGNERKKDLSKASLSNVVATAFRYGPKHSRKEHWIRWWRWCGMLGLASRSLQKADRSLSRALQAAIETTSRFQVRLRHETLEDWDVNTEIQLSSIVSKKHGEQDVNGRYQCLLEALHSMDLAAFTLATKATIWQRKIDLRIEQQESTEQERRRADLLEKAEQIAVRGLQLIDEAQRSKIPQESHDFDLQWCKSRLLISAGLASMRNPNRKHDSPHAMSLFGGAAACLRSTTPERTRADIALIELRRADVRLQEASEMKIGEEHFDRWTYDRLLGDSIEQKLPQQPGESPTPTMSQLGIVTELRRSWRDSHQQVNDNKSVQSVLHNITARATDALRFLDRAFPTLRERRRNVWWTTWYFERRMKAISFLLWTSVVESGQPIPFLGLEAVMRRTDSEPDTLMIDAMRMIRVDAYRLATVLLFYASCARALQLRLALDDTTVILNQRRMRMKQILNEGRDALRDTILRREKGSTDLPEGEALPRAPRARNADMGTDVKAVIDQIEILVNGVIRSL